MKDMDEAGRMPNRMRACVRALPDLPTVVGLPGHRIDREVGGHVCLIYNIPPKAAER